jgi:hypothetical protein
MDFLKTFLVIPLNKEAYPRGMCPSNHSINSSSVRHFGGLKVRFFKGRQTLDPQVSSIHKFSVKNLVAWQWDFSRVMRLLAEDYMTSDEQLFVILAAWKSESCRVVKFSNLGQLTSCQPLLDILATSKCDSSKVYETLRSRVSCFHLDTIRYYGDLKKTFLNRPETFGGRLRG